HLALAQLFSKKGQPRRARTHAMLAGTELEWEPPSANVTASRPRDREPRPSEPSAKDSHPSEASPADVHRLCAACHAYPPPETMPRSAWRKEVKQGYDFLRNSSLTGDFPALENVVLYYEQRAPEQLPAVEPIATTAKPPVKFDKRGTGWMPNVPPYPTIA